ncbi:MAG TPA: GTP cyclohydrolase I [Microbacteriaceae bacterium]|nr:GTP cyclohydrolase I [Microbacteriaceae bacterium]
MSVDRSRIEHAVRELLEAIGESPDRPGLERTPARVADSYAEFFAGIDVDPLDHLRATLPVEEAGTSEAVILRDIGFRSVCEHHLLPFVGVAHVAYLPHQRLIGLSRIPDLIATLSARLQLQERLAENIADALEEGLAPRGVLVVLDAVHRCVAARGSRQSESSTVTVVSRGVLADPLARAEIMGLIGASRV